MKKTIFRCKKCGYQSAKWLGRCPECGGWDVFDEAGISSKDRASNSDVRIYKPGDLVPSLDERLRFKISGLNSFFGGGIARGSVVLFAGEPGIGKSTFLMQLGEWLDGVKILYVSTEENEFQVASRVKRLGLKNIEFFSNQYVEIICDKAADLKPDVLVVDSIQMAFLKNEDTNYGSVLQLKSAAEHLVRFAKQHDVAVFITGHVTKSGDIAGPKILEHMVDVIVYMEGDRSSDVRFVKMLKNRFGPCDEVLLFKMESSGLSLVENPSLFFVSERPVNSSGSVISGVVEGNSSFIIEIQALVVPTFYSNPRRLVSRYDPSRLHILCAVAEKRLNLSLSNYDIFLNVPGGIIIKDLGVDLAVICALYSSYVDRPVDDILILGEVGLSGEVRSVRSAELLVKEAISLGISRVLLPYGNCGKLKKLKDKIKIFGVKNVMEAVDYVFSG